MRTAPGWLSQHSGYLPACCFTGPAIGGYYTQFIKEFHGEVDKLLGRVAAKSKTYQQRLRKKFLKIYVCAIF